MDLEFAFGESVVVRHILDSENIQQVAAGQAKEHTYCSVYNEYEVCTSAMKNVDGEYAENMAKLLVHKSSVLVLQQR